MTATTPLPPRPDTPVPETPVPAEARPSANHLWIALAHAYRHLASLVEGSVASLGLGLTDFMLLEALLHKGPLTIGEVQASVLLATGSMTAAVDRVERKGLIVRTAVASDRRARRLELTDAGRTLIHDAYLRHSADLARWMDVLTAPEQACAFRALRKLARHASAAAPPAPS